MNKQIEKYLLDLVKRNYEKIAADFDNTRKKYLWPEIVKLAEQVKDGSRVLDAGCGNGRLLRVFSEKKIDYVGIDNSKELIKTAVNNFQIPITNNQTNYKSQFLNKIKNTKFILGDIIELDKFKENNFTYVFCVAVLHHLPGKDLRVKALKQMKNKISNNGKIIITVWNLWPQTEFRKLIFKFGLFKLIGKNKMDLGDILFDWKNNRGQPLSRRYYHAFSKNELKKLAVRAGLKIEKLYKDSYNYYIILTK